MTAWGRGLNVPAFFSSKPTIFPSLQLAHWTVAPSAPMAARCSPLILRVQATFWVHRGPAELPGRAGPAATDLRASVASFGTGLGLNPCSRPGEKRARGSVGC